MAQDSEFIAQSLFASGVVVAPALNTALCSIVAPPKGYYDVEVTVGFGATAEATTPNNFHFNRAGSIIYQNLPAPGGVNSLYSHYFRRVFFNGAQNATLQNTTAGSAGAVYNCSITLHPVQ